mmetsp:Transcript_26426/g.37102  ORF Transcript_26426/g.37102 Transcript_26426/m.37102 type:complete len:115 (+) Transcript_26426:184-528(+)
MRHNRLCFEVILDRKSSEGKNFDRVYSDALMNSCAAFVDKKSRAKGLGPDVSAREEIKLFDPAVETEEQFERRMLQPNANHVEGEDLEETEAQARADREVARILASDFTFTTSV